MKILHTADIHLRKKGDVCWKAFEEIINIANKENVDVLVIAEDMFDNSYRSYYIHSGAG